MSKAELDTMIRNDILNDIAKILSEKYDTDVLPVSASELTIPVLDIEKNEKYVLVKVSIPRGTRTGSGSYIPYDGYKAHKDYMAAQETKSAKKMASLAKKEQEEKLRAQKREARLTKKAIAKLEKAVQAYEEKKGE